MYLALLGAIEHRNLPKMLEWVELDKLKCPKRGYRVYHVRYYFYLQLHSAMGNEW